MGYGITFGIIVAYSIMGLFTAHMADEIDWSDGSDGCILMFFWFWWLFIWIILPVYAYKKLF